MKPRGRNLNRSDVVRALAAAHDIDESDARHYLDSLLGLIADTLADGRKVSFIGFGVFTLRRRNARTATNPATGQPMIIEAADVPMFRSAPRLRQVVNDTRLSA